MNILQVIVTYSFDNKQSNFYVKGLLFGCLCIYKRSLVGENIMADVPKKADEFKNKTKNIFRKSKSVKNSIREMIAYKNILERAASHSIKCKKIAGIIAYGDEDPSLTGWLTGVFYTLKPFCMKRLAKWCALSNDDIEVLWQPSFNETALKVDLKAVFAIKSWQLLKYLFKIIFLKVR